jgi:hypothetical protein
VFSTIDSTPQLELEEPKCLTNRTLKLESPDLDPERVPMYNGMGTGIKGAAIPVNGYTYGPACSASECGELGRVSCCFC